MPSSPQSTVAEHPDTQQGTADTFGWVETCAGCGELSDVSTLQPLQEYACWKCGAQAQAMKRFGNLELEALIGTGGMASVYRARDTILDRTVALKLLLGEVTRDPARSAALQREALLTASIAHPNVVKIYDAGTMGKTCFVIMELLENGTLAEKIETSGSFSLSETEVLKYGIQLAEGLRAAFSKGLLHRDIKPGNILFRDAQTIKVADFGLALTAAEAATAGTGKWGSPHYVSPERNAGLPEDLRSDIYSVGATLFHALAGRAPFEGEDPNLVAKKRVESQAPNVRFFAPGVSEKTAALLCKALHRQPVERFQNYDELIAALEACAAALSKKKSGRKAAAAESAANGAAPVKGSGWVGYAVAAALLVNGLGWAYFGSGQRWLKHAPLATVVSVNPSAPAAAKANPEASSAPADRHPALFGIPNSVSIDLGAPAAINRWVARDAGTGRKEADISIKLEAYDEGAGWHEIDRFKGPMQSIDREVPPFTARYVRVSIPESLAKNEIGHRFADFELFGPKGKVRGTPDAEANLARKKKTFDQGNHPPDVHPPEAAVDDVAPTIWETTEDPGWVAVDLGVAKKIDRWIALHAGASFTTARPRPSAWDSIQFKLQASGDAKDWRDIDVVTDNHSDLTDRRVPAFSARYVRIVVLERGLNEETKARVSELQLYAPDK